MKSISHSIYQSLQYSRLDHISWLYMLGFCLSLIGGIAVATLTEQYVVAGAIVGTVPLIVLVVQYPRVLLYLWTISLTIWWRNSDQDITTVELILVAVYWGWIGIWFIYKIIAREAIIYYFSDRIMLFIFSLSLCNLAFALFNDVTLMRWLREYFLFALILLYFPLRDSLTSKRHINNFIYLLACVVAVLGGINIHKYINAANNAVYAFNLLSSRVALNEVVFLGASLISTAFLLFVHSKKAKTILLLLTLFYSAVLIASFTRGAWLAFILGEILIFIVIKERKKWSLIAYMLFATISFIVIITVYFSGIRDFVFHSIESRLISSTKGVGDISFNNRIKESEATIDAIIQQPLTGHGMGARILFYDIIDRETSRPQFLHNGYLFLSYKLGIPVTVLFLSVFLLYIIKGVTLYRKEIPIFYRYMMIGVVASFVTTMILSISSNQFIQRDGIFLFTIYVTLISVVDKQYNILSRHSTLSTSQVAK